MKRTPLALRSDTIRHLTIAQFGSAHGGQQDGTTQTSAGTDCCPTGPGGPDPAPTIAGCPNPTFILCPHPTGTQPV